jgi:hypothetical protein
MSASAMIDAARSGHIGHPAACQQPHPCSGGPVSVAVGALSARRHRGPLVVLVSAETIAADNDDPAQVEPQHESGSAASAS